MWTSSILTRALHRRVFVCHRNLDGCDVNSLGGWGGGEAQLRCHDETSKARVEPEMALPPERLKFIKHSEGEATSISDGGLRRGFPLVHLIVCWPSRKLGPCLHFPTRCRAGSYVLPGLSRPLRASGKAPPPYRQEGVDSVNTCHQEAKGLRARGGEEVQQQ